MLEASAQTVRPDRRHQGAPELSVIVPTYRCDKDEKALRILQECFPARRVIGIDSTEIIWGLGSFHCLSQQEPAV